MEDTILQNKFTFCEESLNKRNRKLCQKLQECTNEQKRSCLVKLIEECSYNQTSNAPKFMRPFIPGKKSMRKKTGEELKLLEYFLEQDPSWSRKTINSAAKVLGLTPYQVYKWGYDRKNKKMTKNQTQFLRELEITNTMIEKINKFDNEIKGGSKIDLNRQVEDLFGSVAKTKGSSATLSEIPIGQLSLHQSSTQNSPILDESNFCPFEDEKPAKELVFSVTKVNRKRKCASENGESSLKNLSNKLQNKLISFRTEGQKYKWNKIDDRDDNDVVSERTLDKSSVSTPAQHHHADVMSQTFEHSPLSE